LEEGKDCRYIGKLIFSWSAILEIIASSGALPIFPPQGNILLAIFYCPEGPTCHVISFAHFFLREKKCYFLWFDLRNVPYFPSNFILQRHDNLIEFLFAKNKIKMRIWCMIN
jgi:hypothetical protein